MLEDLLMSGLPRLPNPFASIPLPGDGMAMITLFSLAAALILTRFTEGAKVLTLPVNYASLFIGSMFANQMLAGVYLPHTSAMQRVFMICLFTHVFISPLLLWTFSTSRQTVR